LLHLFGDEALDFGQFVVGDDDADGEMRHGLPPVKGWVEKAEFGELAFEFLLFGVEFQLVKGGKFVDDLNHPGITGMDVGDVLHNLNPFKGWRALRPAGLISLSFRWRRGA
jgi:hypothetical protein